MSNYHKQGVRLCDDAEELLLDYGWPYNVRQLANEMRRLVMLSRNDEIIGVDRVSTDIRGGADSRQSKAVAFSSHTSHTIKIGINMSYREAKDELERLFIFYALKETGGNLLRTAARMQMSRNGLKMAIERLGINVERTFTCKSSAKNACVVATDGH